MTLVIFKASHKNLLFLSMAQCFISVSLTQLIQLLKIKWKLTKPNHPYLGFPKLLIIPFLQANLLIWILFLDTQKVRVMSFDPIHGKKLFILSKYQVLQEFEMLRSQLLAQIHRIPVNSAHPAILSN